MSIIDITANTNKLTHIDYKIKMMVGIILLTISLIVNNAYIQLGIIIGVLIILIMIARISPKIILRVYKMPLGFILLSVIVMMVGFSNDTSIFHNEFKIGSVYIGITKPGFANAIKTLFRTFSAISSTLFIALTTPLNQQIKGFKLIRIPDVVIQQMVLIYRFISVFFNEMHEMEDAIKLRTGYKKRSLWLRSSAVLASSLFMRIMKSFDDWKNALELRMGFEESGGDK